MVSGRSTVKVSPTPATTSSRRMAATPCFLPSLPSAARSGRTWLLGTSWPTLYLKCGPWMERVLIKRDDATMVEFQTPRQVLTGSDWGLLLSVTQSTIEL